MLRCSCRGTLTFSTHGSHCTILLWNSFSLGAAVTSCISWSSGSSACTNLTLIFQKTNSISRPTHDPSIDTFRVEYLAGPAIVLAFIFNYGFKFSEISWSFSIWLEAVAILPQLFMLQRTGEAETITTHYLAALGAYRAFYIPNWIYRWSLPFFACATWQPNFGLPRYFANDVVDPIAIVAGLVQTGLYIDFFYVYFTKCVFNCTFLPCLTVLLFRVLQGEKFELPA